MNILFQGEELQEWYAFLGASRCVETGKRNIRHLPAIGYGLGVAEPQESWIASAILKGTDWCWHLRLHDIGFYTWYLSRQI